MQTSKIYIITAAVLGALAVGFGAFGAHGLREILSPRMLEVYQTAVKYQMFHVSALLGVGILLKSSENNTWLRLAGFFFIVGTTVFSGSLYTLSITGVRWLGAITPVGGVFFIIGWLLLGWSLLAKNKAN